LLSPATRGKVFLAANQETTVFWKKFGNGMDDLLWGVLDPKAPRGEKRVEDGGYLRKHVYYKK